ncbi:MAG: histone-like nucleoid-structuring protein Lsr2 [Acidimicrobiales bacterium]
MARRQVEVVTCDLEDGDVSAAESLTFSFGGKTYTLDLCKKHLEEVRGALERFAAAGHTSGGRGGRGRRRPATAGRGGRAARATGPAGAPRGESQAPIREWARSAGYAVGDRGRIPAEVREAYEAAQSKGSRRR